MYSRIDASKSTKGASKLRRDLINAEIANLRDLLPLPPSTRQRLSQLQLMALVCVFLRKANYFQQALKNYPSDNSSIPTPNIGFSKAMSGFIMMMTQQGKLLYISENAAEYLGHSMLKNVEQMSKESIRDRLQEDLLIHGDSVYDVIDKQDHVIVQNQLTRNNSDSNDKRLFLCRINVSRNSRRQLRFGDQKVVLVEGHFLPFIPVCSRNDFVFLASCTPVVLPETRESIVQGATNIFTSIHSMDMKYLHVDKTAECHLEYSRSDLIGVSWYNLLHWDSVRTAYCKHQTVIQSDQERSSTALLRLQTRTGKWFWVHCVLQVKDTSEDCQHPIIVCTNQVLSDKEAEVMRSSNWLYRYSSQTKFTYALCPGNQTSCMSYVTQTNQQQQKSGTDLFNRRAVCDIDAPNEFYFISKLESRELRCTTITSRDDTEPVDMSITSIDHNVTERSMLAPLQNIVPLQSRQPEHVAKLAQHTTVSANSATLVPTTSPLTNVGALAVAATTAPSTTPASTVTPTSSTAISSTGTTTQTTLAVTKSTSATGKYRAKFLQYQSEYSSAQASFKYYITDLDKDPYLDRENASASSICKKLPSKILPGSICPTGSTEPQESALDQWHSSSSWFEIPQRMPDLIHHDLSPHIVTPTTPTEQQTPNSNLHTDAQIFNFDWPIEQHVPNLKLTLQSTGYDTRKHQETIALQLPRRRSHPIDRAKDFLK